MNEKDFKKYYPEKFNEIESIVAFGPEFPQRGEIRLPDEDIKVNENCILYVYKRFSIKLPDESIVEMRITFGQNTKEQMVYLRDITSEKNIKLIINPKIGKGE
jgi:hypothetical protein